MGFGAGSASRRSAAGGDAGTGGADCAGPPQGLEQEAPPLLLEVARVVLQAFARSLIRPKPAVQRHDQPGGQMELAQRTAGDRVE